MIVTRSLIVRIMTGIVVVGAVVVAVLNCAHRVTTTSAPARMTEIASVSVICATSETEAPIGIGICTRRTNMQVC